MTDKLKAVHDRAMKAFDATYMPQQENRAQCLEDRLFYFAPGAQWNTANGGLDSDFANRPKFEVNKVHLAIMRLFSEYRNNRISVNFKAKDNAASSDTAEVLNGLYRADEQESNAQEAYDNAFEEAASGGIGAWKVKPRHEDEYDEEDDRQRIDITPIFDAESNVFFDVSARRQDKADAVKCWNIFTMTPEDFKERFGQEPVSFDSVDTCPASYFFWAQPDLVRVAEYYEVEEIKQTYAFYRHKNPELVKDEHKINLDDGDKDEIAAQIAEWVDQGFEQYRTKKIKTRKVHLYVMDGGCILEDHGYIAGKYIPIIPVYGKRVIINNIELASGHVRLSKDIQQIYNIILSALVETAAEGGQQVPIFTPAQISGHESLWNYKHIDKPAYLTINERVDENGNLLPVAPTAYTQPPVLPPALTALMQIADADIAQLTGNQQNGDEMVSNIATETVEKIQERLDMVSFIYMDNMAKAMRHSGVVWQSMAQDLYVEEGREMQAVYEDGTQEPITLMRPIMKDGVQDYENNVSAGKYDATVDVGASFNSRKDKTVNGLRALLPNVPDPQIQAAIVNTIILNTEGEGLTDLKAFSRKNLLNMGAADPTDDEIKQAQEAQANAANQPPDAQTQYLQAASAEAQAKAKEAEAKTAKTLADTDKTNAETAKTLFEIQQQQQNLSQFMQQLVPLLDTLKQQQSMQQQQITASVEGQPQQQPDLPPQIEQAQGIEGNPMQPDQFTPPNGDQLA